MNLIFALTFDLRHQSHPALIENIPYNSSELDMVLTGYSLNYQADGDLSLLWETVTGTGTVHHMLSCIQKNQLTGHFYSKFYI